MTPLCGGGRDSVAPDDRPLPCTETSARVRALAAVLAAGFLRIQSARLASTLKPPDVSGDTGLEESTPHHSLSVDSRGRSKRSLSRGLVTLTAREEVER